MSTSAHLYAEEYKHRVLSGIKSQRASHGGTPASVTLLEELRVEGVERDRWHAGSSLALALTLYLSHTLTPVQNNSRCCCLSLNFSLRQTAEWAIATGWLTRMG